jgi:hypothetical protein
MWPSVMTPSATDRMRAVVVHYHFFKTAGTSFSRTLQTNFGSSYAPIEAGGETPNPTGKLLPDELRDYLLKHPEVKAISSHTLELPPPMLESAIVLPVTFVRHPIDRVRSVYEFERHQKQDTPGSIKARTMTISEFIEWRLGVARNGGDRSFMNFQTYRLSKGSSEGSELDRALRMVEGRLIVGVVERYDRSLERIGKAISQWFPNVALETHHDNRTAATSFDARMDMLRDDLGPALFGELEEANVDDMRLWQTALSQLEAATLV